MTQVTAKTVQELQTITPSPSIDGKPVEIIKKGIPSSLKDGFHLCQEGSSVNGGANTVQPASASMVKYLEQLSLASESADSGSVGTMESHLHMAEIYAENGGITLDEPRIAEIEKRGYGNGVNSELVIAERFADFGDVVAMNRAVDLARNYSQMSGTSLDTDRVKEIYRKGYTQGIEKKLRTAETAASIGEPGRMESELREVEAYSLKLQIPLDSVRVAQIRVDGYTNGYEGWLNDALFYANNGHNGSAVTAIANARACAEKAGITVDEVRIQEIEGILKTRVE